MSDTSVVAGSSPHPRPALLELARLAGHFYALVSKLHRFATLPVVVPIAVKVGGRKCYLVIGNLNDSIDSAAAESAASPSTPRAVSVGHKAIAVSTVKYEPEVCPTTYCRHVGETIAVEVACGGRDIMS